MHSHNLASMLARDVKLPYLSRLLPKPGEKRHRPTSDSAVFPLTEDALRFGAHTLEPYYPVETFLNEAATQPPNASLQHVATGRAGHAAQAPAAARAAQTGAQCRPQGQMQPRGQVLSLCEAGPCLQTSALTSVPASARGLGLSHRRAGAAAEATTRRPSGDHGDLFKPLSAHADGELDVDLNFLHSPSPETTFS